MMQDQSISTFATLRTSTNKIQPFFSNMKKSLSFVYILSLFSLGQVYGQSCEDGKEPVLAASGDWMCVSKTDVAHCPQAGYTLITFPNDKGSCMLNEGYSEIPDQASKLMFLDSNKEPRYVYIDFALKEDESPFLVFKSAPVGRTFGDNSRSNFGFETPADSLTAKVTWGLNNRPLSGYSSAISSNGNDTYYLRLEGDTPFVLKVKEGKLQVDDKSDRCIIMSGDYLVYYSSGATDKYKQQCIDTFKQIKKGDDKIGQSQANQLEYFSTRNQAAKSAAEVERKKTQIDAQAREIAQSALMGRNFFAPEMPCKKNSSVCPQGLTECGDVCIASSYCDWFHRARIMVGRHLQPGVVDETLLIAKGSINILAADTYNTCPDKSGKVVKATPKLSILLNTTASEYGRYIRWFDLAVPFQACRKVSKCDLDLEVDCGDVCFSKQQNGKAQCDLFTASRYEAGLQIEKENYAITPVGESGVFVPGKESKEKYVSWGASLTSGFLRADRYPNCTVAAAATAKL
jgi:hypothetical protein